MKFCPELQMVIDHARRIGPLIIHNVIFAAAQFQSTQITAQLSARSACNSDEQKLSGNIRKPKSRNVDESPVQIVQKMR